MKPRAPITPAAATAAVLADDLVPESLYYTLHGGRNSFQGFEKEGLPIYIQNRRRCVRPSELRAFITARATLINPAAVQAGPLAATLADPDSPSAINVGRRGVQRTTPAPISKAPQTPPQ